jgi:hypothetical protein
VNEREREQHADDVATLSAALPASQSRFWNDEDARRAEVERWDAKRERERRPRSVIRAPWNWRDR